MFSLKKIQIPQQSDFDVVRAIELANLIAIAYNEYEVWDRIDTFQNQKPLPQNEIIGSNAFIPLNTDNREKFSNNKTPQTKSDYQRLDSYWQQKPESLLKYDRLAHFWFPQWWWGEVLKLDRLTNFLQTNVRDIWQNLGRLISQDQIFGFIARSQTNPNQYFIVFRGTREGAEWFNNFRPVPQVFLNDSKLGLGEVRNGFNLIYTRKRKGIDLDKWLKLERPLSIQKTIEDFVQKHLDDNSEIFITGHSLGAALATLAASHLHYLALEKNINPSINLYTIASPRVGDKIFANAFNNSQVTLNSYRIINSEDLIQSIPFPTTQVLDKESLDGMSGTTQARFFALKAILETIIGGQSEKEYEHVGIPVTFTHQTGTIGGNHNLTKTYREALNI